MTGEVTLDSSRPLRHMNAAMEARNVIIALIIGLAAGWLASFVVGGGGLVRYLISGVIGSFVGSFVLAKAGLDLGIGNEIVRDVVTAAIGAIIVVLAARLIA
jgi:uncharacterized membrane protein YeaQ/YmgE (transglycosylase-associated protein family)